MTTALTLHSLDREKLNLIKNTVAKGATDLELQLFFHACERTGLDPLMKQIYAIKRWNHKEKRETLTFQTGIDGYRLIADRTGLYAGSTEPTYQVNAEGFPELATVTVTKLINGLPYQFSASARWTEYVQRTTDGHPNSMWQRMPFLMLGKCAEALALRKAFPAELSGVYTHEEMMQADNDSVRTAAVRTAKQAALTKIAELRKEAALHEELAPPAEDGTYHYTMTAQQTNADAISVPPLAPPEVDGTGQDTPPDSAQQASDAPPASSALFDASVAMRECITEQEINALLVTAKQTLAPQDFATLQTVAKERRRQLRGK